MTKKIYCSIPDVCLDVSQDVTAQVRSQLKRAVAAGIEPSSIPRGIRSQTIAIDEPELSAVMALSHARDVVPGKIIGGLLYAQHLGTRHPDKGGPQDRQQIVEPVLAGLRAGQTRVLQQMAPHLMSGKVLFSECGTGTGKARLIAHAAAYLLDARDKGISAPTPDIEAMLKGDKKELPDWLRKHVKDAVAVHASRLQELAANKPEPACVIACAPTIENVAHLVAEWLAVRFELDPKGLRRVAVRLGRAQFVNPSALQSLLDEAMGEGGCDYPNIMKWLEQMPAGKTSATKALLAVEPGLCGLMIDLMAVAEEDFKAGRKIIDIKACALTNDTVLDDLEDSVNFTEHLKHSAEGADLLFTTTAMLCLDNLQLKNENSHGIFPPNVAGLLIDEAHQLESTQANLAAKGLSLSRMIADLKQLIPVTTGKHAESALKKVKELRDLLAQFEDESPLPPPEPDRDLHERWTSSLGLMKLIEEDLNAITQKRKKNELAPAGSKAMRSIKATAATLKYATKGTEEKTVHGFLSQSPVKGYISMAFGPANVSRYLMSRWAVTPCAVLMSGTLFHISATGASARNVAASVGALSRYAQTDPLHPSWLFKPVEVIQPSLENFHRFIPPKRDKATDAALQSWLEATAEVIINASKKAGGMLVLMSGYKRLELLYKLLAAGLPEADRCRLIAQARHNSTSVMSEQFRTLSRQGIRPIWLATGAAWTGLDLSDRDVEPEDDWLLTDLVIPAVPFSMNRSTTHINRMKHMGFVAETIEAQKITRQAFGRLVRREGVTDRRIWMLDGRLVNPATAQSFTDVSRAMTPYLKRTSLA